MNQREEAIRQDIYAFRTLAFSALSSLNEILFALAIAQKKASPALLNEKDQAAALYEMYEGVINLAERLGESWEEALAVTRESANEGSTDMAIHAACATLMRQTGHLFSK
jgi:hypothetical protein